MKSITYSGADGFVSSLCPVRVWVPNGSTANDGVRVSELPPVGKRVASCKSVIRPAATAAVPGGASGGRMTMFKFDFG